MKQLRDPFFQQAKREGYAARSAYKLAQIDEKRRLLRNGQRVLDLGAAPGSWLQYAHKRIGAQGTLVGVDLQPITASLPLRVRRVQADVHTLTPALLGDITFDVILSDMAPRTTGIPTADAARSAELALHCLALCRRLLAPGGTALVKVFQGAELPDLRAAYAALFSRVRLEKPAASRSESVEIFLLGEKRKPSGEEGAA